jgi:hypothetical protein
MSMCCTYCYQLLILFPERILCVIYDILHFGVFTYSVVSQGLPYRDAIFCRVESISKQYKILIFNYEFSAQSFSLIYKYALLKQRYESIIFVDSVGIAVNYFVVKHFLLKQLMFRKARNLYDFNIIFWANLHFNTSNKKHLVFE